LLTAFTAFVLAAAATWAMIPWLAGRGALAHENERTLHTGVIPKGGGVPLLLAMLAALLAFHPLASAPLPLLAGLALATAISWRDDVNPLPASARLPVHLAAAAIFVLSLPPGALVLQGLVPLALDRIIAIVALGWMMNLFNFMDGINGIAGVEALSIACGYILIAAAGAQLAYTPLAAALAGACAGFLVWNLRNRALVFLGDVGSVPLGYLSGALMIDLATQGYWLAALILPSYFLADATLTLLRRLIRGEKIWEAHRSHYYQRAAQGLGAHLPVVWRVAAANVSLIAAALWSTRLPIIAAAAAGITLLALFALLVRAHNPDA